MQVLFDEGALVRNGTVKLTRSLNELHIPPTVQVILASRIDRLPADEKGATADTGGDGQGVSAGIGQAGDWKVRRRAGTDARRSAARRVHLRAARAARRRVHLQALADPGSRLQLGPD